MTVTDAIRRYLRAHPGSSKTALIAGVPGSARAVTTAFEDLLTRGEASYKPPARPGQPGRCALVSRVTCTETIVRNGHPAKWKPRVICPRCGYPPAVRYTEREVRRAHLDAQETHLVNVQCTRSKPFPCRTHYWIRAEHVAAATLDSTGRAQ